MSWVAVPRPLLVRMYPSGCPVVFCVRFVVLESLLSCVGLVYCFRPSVRFRPPPKPFACVDVPPLLFTILSGKRCSDFLA